MANQIRLAIRRRVGRLADKLRPTIRKLARFDSDRKAGTKRNEGYREYWIRELDGAVVTFDDGAAITKVSLPADFSAVRINDLPADSSPATVASLLCKLNFIVSAENVQVRQVANRDCCSADVTVEDPMFASRLADRLRRTAHAPRLEAIPVSVPMPRAADAHPVDYRTVLCSWPEPACGARLNNDAEQDALWAYEISGFNRVLDCSTPGANVPAVERDARDFDPWTGTTGIEDLRLYEMANEISGSEPLDIARSTKEMLRRLGPLEWWGLTSTNPLRSRVKAYARFEQEADAKQAAVLLNGALLPWTGEMEVRLVVSVEYRVLTRIFDVVRARIASKTPAWEENQVRCFACPLDRRYHVLMLVGEDNQRVAQVKKTLESIIRGEVIMKDGKALWSPKFGGRPYELRWLRYIERDLGVVIRRDTQRPQFRLFGPEECHNQVAEAMHTLVASTSTRVGVCGPAARNRDRACARQDEPDNQLDGLTACSVCWGEAEDPIRTSCQHDYCLACFAALCQAEPPASTGFRICCVGERGRCNLPIPLSDIQAFLPPAAFEAILASSFAAHLRRHPADFRFCPSPGCTQVYRPTTAPPRPAPAITFTCPRCRTATCTACHYHYRSRHHAGTVSSPLLAAARPVRHPTPAFSLFFGATTPCGSHAKADVDAANASLKKRLGIKDCPRCDTALEKVAGCDVVSI
ncbi:a99ff611-9fbb-4fe4-80df-42763c27544f [Thermothielavioides terrestris]|uniref:A99ff611-9fbb-4fe4-80df-42763c27544f n=1 Tax=Thermothielavioides terrestris TaxID=2587410 RepID=A0A3S4D234_9PEZI|nr:a99ff611-9fbb-4fe4-80df-42763c27544f [Thermothielavioides terrestris]